MDPTASDSSRINYAELQVVKAAASSVKVRCHAAVSDMRFTLQVTGNSSTTAVASTWMSEIGY